MWLDSVVPRIRHIIKNLKKHVPLNCYNINLHKKNQGDEEKLRNLVRRMTANLEWLEDSPLFASKTQAHTAHSCTTFILIVQHYLQEIIMEIIWREKIKEKYEYF